MLKQERAFAKLLTQSDALTLLQLVQTTAARLLTKTGWNDHIRPVVASFHWLPVKFKITLIIDPQKEISVPASYIQDKHRMQSKNNRIRKCTA